MSYLPAYDANNGWEPEPGDRGAEQGTAPKTLWYLQDALGSTLGLVEKDGRVSSRYHYDEFGVALDAKKFDLNWPGPDNLFGYTGLGYDYYSDLTYARARYYKPEIGRFISEDMYEGNLINPLSQNHFTYVENNPINLFDPSGHIGIANYGCNQKCKEDKKAKREIYDIISNQYGFLASIRPDAQGVLNKIVHYKEHINQVGEYWGVPSNIIGSIIIKEQFTKSIPDWVAMSDTLARGGLHSVGLGAIFPDVAIDAWVEVDIVKAYMELPINEEVDLAVAVQSKLYSDDEFNIETQ
ncbi:MAG: RHS repeat-associated core domain-containing protein [Paenibacillaceae bacterium]